MLELLHFAERFQTAIVGIIGFLGVMLTIRMNAKAARMLQEQQIESDRRALRCELCAELELVRVYFQEVCEGNTNRKTSGEPASICIPNLPPIPIYTNAIGKIGLLSEREVTAVVEAYNALREAPMRIKLLFILRPESGRPIDSLDYFYVGAPNVKNVVRIYKNFLPSIDKAIAALREEIRANRFEPKS